MAKQLLNNNNFTVLDGQHRMAAVTQFANDLREMHENGEIRIREKKLRALDDDWKPSQEQ